MTKEIKKQIAFVKWLKEKKLYWPYESAANMVKLQAVWEAAGLGSLSP